MSTRTLGQVAQGARRPRTAVGAVLTLVALMIAGYAGAPSASAYPVQSRPVSASSDTGTAAVIGTVTFTATPPGSPSGTVVTLTEIPASGNAETRTTRADARGAFRFDGVAGGPDWTYSVAATYLGTTFESDSVQVEASKTVDVPLRLFVSTTSAASVSQPTWDVWIDTTATGIAVQQDVSLTNKGTAAYTGSTQVPDAPAGLDHAAFTLPITEKADNLEFLGRFQACCTYVKGATWTHTRPISPGTSTGTLRYESPSVTSLTFPVALPTTAFRLFVADGLTITSPQLSRNGTSNDRGVTYTVYAATGALKPGDTVAVTLTGAPVESSGPSWWIVALVGVVLVAALVVIALLARRRRAGAAAATPTLAPGTKGDRTQRDRTQGDRARAAGAATSAKAPKKSPTAQQKAAPQPKKPAPPKAAPQEQTAPEQPAAATAAPGTPETPVKTPTIGRRTRADELTDELAMLDLAWEDGTITDERAYRRIRESLVAQLVAEVSDDA